MERHHVVDTPVGPMAIRVAGHGRPVVLWHSLFVDERSWDRVVPHLSAGRQLVIITGPGHGSSGDPGHRYTVDDCAAAARSTLVRLGITEPVDWVGNAWGGHVGATFAAGWPERCRSLVMFGTPIAPLRAFERARTHVLLSLYRLAGPSTAVVDGTTKVLLSAHTRVHDRAAVDLVHDCLRRADRRMLRNAIVSVSLHRRDLSATLQRLTQPTLIVTGSDHHGFTPEQAHAGATLLRNGRAAVVPNAAYLVPLEAPDAAAGLVTDFWASHTTAPAS